MQCPDCGYDADDAAVFCPQCRFRFRNEEDGPAVATETTADMANHGFDADESIFETPPGGFSEKELRQLEVQLIQPTVLIVLIISLGMYTVISTVPFIPLTIAGLNFGITGILCLACGVLAGILFFVLSRQSLAKFRCR
jgi:hypothetical protein